MKKLKIRLTISALTLASFLVPFIAIMDSQEIKHLALGNTPELEAQSVLALPSETQIRAVKSPISIPPRKIASSKSSASAISQSTPIPPPTITIPKISTKTRTS